MRIGLIGSGAVASLHSRAATALPGLEMTAVCDLQPEVAEVVAGPIGASVFTDYRDLLASGLTDAVIVNTPHSLHREMAVAATEVGQHVLVEKPMAITLEDCDVMIRAAERAGVVLQVGHIQHFLPEKVALASALSRGVIGPVRLIHDYRTTNYRPGSRAPWFLDRELAGGGVVMNIGAHCLDRITWFGGGRAIEISASTVNRFGVDVETDATINLRLADGVIATVVVASDLPHPHDEVTVIGEEGTLVANSRVGTLLRLEGRTEVLHERVDDDIAVAFRNQLADFDASVRGNPSAVSQQHSRHVVELVLATYTSASAGGQPVALGPRPASTRVV